MKLKDIFKEEKMDDNPVQMAKRLSKTRSLFVNDMYQQENEKKKSSRRRQSEAFISGRRQSESVLTKGHKSMPVLPCRRNSETTILSPFDHITPDKLENRISSWLRKSTSALDQDDTLVEEHSSSADDKPIDSIFESDESVGESVGESVDSVISEYSSKLKLEAEKLELPIEDISWSKTGCDLILKVNETLFPVDKNFVSYVSLFFQQLISNSFTDNPACTHINMDGYDTNCVFTALKFIYSSNDEDITDDKVATFLLLSEEFKISRLRFQCDKYLQESSTFNPLIAIQLANKYQLDELKNIKCHDVSKIKGFEETQEFECLDADTQNKILKYSLQRYKKSAKILSQIDVHLCYHHGSEPKQNTCCYRAATYNTCEGRTFLVKMESPESKMVERYENVFKADLIDKMS